MDWVDCILDTPTELAETTRSFWAAALGWEIGEPWPGHPEFVSLEPPQGESPLHVQVIDGRPRLHVDLTVRDIDAERFRLLGLGATEAARTEDWQVMASPGGLPFCLVRESRGTARPSAVRWLDGHATNLVQVCIDSPEHLHDDEVAFWRAATGWDLHPSESPEFAGKCYPEDGPIHFLFQRLGPDDDGGQTRAHLDLASDDLPAEVDRLMSLGATLAGPGSGWVALKDPTGMPFCVTAQPP
jgi:hypothetical protein